MKPEFILCLMIFAHIVDDYYLQGVLASMKQKAWWKDNAPMEMYRFDYIAALLAHAFSWAFMIMLPVALASELSIAPWLYSTGLIVNMGIHAIVDDLKVNRKTINLITDQFVHVIQIMVTWYCLVLNA